MAWHAAAYGVSDTTYSMAKRTLLFHDFGNGGDGFVTALAFSDLESMSNCPWNTAPHTHARNWGTLQIRSSVWSDGRLQTNR